jgi:hypothetical protein
VIGFAEESRTATGAGGDDSGDGTPPLELGPCFQQVLVQIDISGHGVTHLELDGLTHSRPIANDDRCPLVIDSENTANQEIAAVEFVPVFVPGETNQQMALGAALLVCR